MTIEPPPTVGTCAFPGCTHLLVAEKRWVALPLDTRAVLRAAGYRQHTCRRLCTRCRQMAARRGLAVGTLPLRMTKRESVLEDWRWLHEQGDLDPADSQAKRIRQAAPRLGMTPAALEQAILRAKRSGDLERAA